MRTVVCGAGLLGDLPGYRKDAAVVVVDAETVRERAADTAIGHQVVGQLRAADLLVLNKTDLVDPDERAGTRAWLRKIAGPSTAIVATSFGAVPVDVVLGTQAAGARCRRPGSTNTSATTGTSTIRASRRGAGAQRRGSAAPAWSRR